MIFMVYLLIELQENRITTIVGGGWNQYLGNHFGNIIWAKTVTYNNDSYQWYKGTGNKKI